MHNKKTQCDTCGHYAVCCLKKAYKNWLNEVSDVKVTDHFNVQIFCKHYKDLNKISDFVARGLNNVQNDMGEIRNSRADSIVFPNGWVANILDKCAKPYLKQSTRYSVAVCDYNGYFDWEVLIPFGAIKDSREGHGCFETDSEDEVCRILSIIENF